MAGRYLAVEMQDESGDVIYPHTEADIVFTSDGKTVEENMSGDITEADLREMFNNIPPEMDSKLSVKEKIKKAFWHYMSLFKMQVLDSVEEIEANTDNGYIMGARAGAEIINNLGGLQFYEDAAGNKYVVGADSVPKKLGSFDRKSILSNTIKLYGSSSWGASRATKTVVVPGTFLCAYMTSGKALSAEIKDQYATMSFTYTYDDSTKALTINCSIGNDGGYMVSNGEYQVTYLYIAD